MGGLAWVTLATNDSYSLGALVLAHSLKQVGTTKQLAVLITPGVTSSMREKLAAVFNVVQEVNILDSKDESNLRLLKRPELGVTFTKLHCWRLTQFDKCVFLDADTLVLQNCDELFDREELSAAPDVGWPDCFNSGVFVYRPSNEMYDKLVSFALEKGSFDGGDQGLLNLYFSDWSTKDISKHLPFIYNLCSTACYSYLPAFKQFGALAKIIHFIGTSKPWLQYFDTETRKVQPSGDLKHLERVLQHWWDIFCNLIHPKLTPEMSGLAGAFAQLTLGAPRTEEQRALDDHLRRQGWEVGNIDYLGRDSFDNIWSKICETLSAGPPAPEPTPKPKEPSPPPTEAKPTETTVIEANVELPKQEIPSSAPVIAPQETIKDSSITPAETAIPQAPQSTISEQPKEVPLTESPKEAPPSESLQCSLPAKEAKSESACALPPKLQEPPADTAKEISAAEASSPKEVAPPAGAGAQVPQATAVPTSAPSQETPAPPQETPVPPQETPAAPQQIQAPPAQPPISSAPPQEATAPPQVAAAAPPQEIPAPAQEVPPTKQETPAPPQEIPAPTQEIPPAKQETPIPPQEIPAPAQEVPPAKQETPAPPQEIPAPAQEVPPTKQETPAPAQEAITPSQQIPPSTQPSPPAQEKTPAEITSAALQVTKDVSPPPTQESCPLPSQAPPAAAQLPTIPTPETPAPPPTTTAPSQEAVSPATPKVPLQKAPESVPAPPKEAVAQPVTSAPPQSAKAAQEAPKTPEVVSAPPPSAPEAAQATAAAAAPPATPPAESPKGKSKAAKEGTEQQKPSTAQGAAGATAASPTPPPRKGPTGGKKTKSKK